MFLKHYMNKIIFGIFTTIFVTSISQASPFEEVDKNARCYSIINNTANKPEKCELQFALLNENISSANVIYKKQIFKISSQRICDGEAIDTCYVENEILEFGRSEKTEQNEYLKLKEEAGHTYFRNELQKKTLVKELFKPIQDNWATCMKSKTYDICIQSKYSIEKLPLLRNEF